ncbi:MAG: hypothetical protein HRU13_12425 [Phycisphaerales bacterium]|nr:hypothetical protein [Phycisphaerales bacterium]
MSLTPRREINFDGTGLAADDDYFVDGNGVGHFHKVKAGSTWKFRLKWTGVDATALTWDMDVRTSVAAAEPTLSTNLTGDALIAVSTNPDGDDTEEVEFTISRAGTLLLQSGGTGNSFVWDLVVTDGSNSDIWVGGTGETTAAVTRSS